MNLEKRGVTAIANKNAIELKLKILINSSVAIDILYHISGHNDLKLHQNVLF